MSSNSSLLTKKNFDVQLFKNEKNGFNSECMNTFDRWLKDYINNIHDSKFSFKNVYNRRHQTFS